MKKRLQSVLALAGLLLAAGCGGEDEALRYEVRGVFVRAQYGGEAAVINHEPIPGFMEAMQMAFRVEDAAAVGGLAPGTKVRFDLVIEDAGSYIERIEALPDTTLLNLADTLLHPAGLAAPPPAAGAP